MRLVLDDGDEPREVLVEVARPDVTIAELLVAADRGAAGDAPAPGDGVADDRDAVTVDGRVVPVGRTLADAKVRDGSTLRLGRHPGPLRRADAPRTPLVVAVVAGTTAGAAVPLDRAVVVGRGQGCDLVLRSRTVSPRHCRLVADGRGSTTVTDLGSGTGTWVDGRRVGEDGVRVGPGAVLRCGAVVLRIEPVPVDDRPRDLDALRPSAAGTVPLNRPPRVRAPVAPPTVEPLPAGPAAGDRPRLPMAALVAPLVVAGAMVALLGDPRFALFALVSPVVLLADAIGQRRRWGRGARAAARDHAGAVARFVAEVEAARAAETRRRWAATPSLAEVRRRATGPSRRLWERRPDDPDRLVLVAGAGSAAFRPTLATPGPDGGVDGAETPLAAEILDAAGPLPDAPVTVDLGEGRVVGIVGDRTAAVALARSLVLQAVVLQGPADLAVAAAVEPRGAGEWAWLSWLPHTAARSPDGDRSVAVGDAAGAALAAGLLRDHDVGTAATNGDGSPEASPTLLLVVDSTSLLRGRDAPVRAVLAGRAGPVAGIVLAATEDQLPAVCRTVVTCRSPHGDAVLERGHGHRVVTDLVVDGCAEQDARAAARRLAGIEDPELGHGPERLPARVDLLPLLGLDPSGPSARVVAARWSATAGSPTLATPVGVGREGPVHLDLVADGPHGLVGGTTGSGKSELLRTLVAGLAAGHDPAHLTFVLVDYKGGAAFDACANLPHVVGLVTDLDEQLGERALRSLEAELAHRERRLRTAGVSDLDAWLRLPASGRGAPLPRLVVVVDEFAALRAELPTFVDALVGIAQRGRSLGVHLVLATQRPAGAVDGDVRANTSLRVALRVADRQDSLDVVDVADAAHVPPSLPGRAIVRVGPAAAVPVQTALVTGRSRRGPAPPVRVEPLRLVPDRRRDAPGPCERTAEPDEPDGPSDLDLLVATCRRAAATAGLAAPRRPWWPPLPERIDLADLDDRVAGGPPAPATDAGVAGARDGPLGRGLLPLGIVDLPDQQAQHVTGWDLDRGPLLVHGLLGAGTSTLATTTVLAACRRLPPDELHVHVLDLGRGALLPLADLPHVGSVVAAREQERRGRLLRWLVAEGARRRALATGPLAHEPRLLVVVDGADQLLADLDTPDGYEQHDALVRLVVDGAGLRMSWLLTTTRAGGLPASLTAGVEQRWAMRLASADDVALLGLRPDRVTALPPGRAVRVGDGALLQVAHPGDAVAAVAAVADLWPAPTTPPVRIGTLPTHVDAPDVAAGLRTPHRGPWRLPVGIAADDLCTAALPLHAGEHALLLGSPGSGCSGLLGVLGEVAAGAGLDVLVVPGRTTSPVVEDGHEVVAPAALGAALHERAVARRPTLVLVDDAERVPDPGASLDALGGDECRVHLVCAARPDAVQYDLGHWLRRVARARVGVVLGPVADAGVADLLGTRPPRRSPEAAGPGRGWVVTAGTARVVQLAAPGGH